MRIIIILIPLLLISIYSCHTPKDTTDSSKPLLGKKYAITLLEEGNNGRFKEDSLYLISDYESFKAYWLKAYGNQLDKPDVPEMEFSTSDIILVTAGTCNSGGYDVALEKVETLNGINIAYKTVTKPGKKCITTEAITHPYKFYLVTPKIKGGISTKKTIQVITCE